MRRILARIRAAFFRLRVSRRRERLIIGPGLELYGRLDVRGPGTARIGANCVVGGIAGDRSQFVTLYTDSPDAQLVIGDNARLFAARVSCKYSIVIGNDTLIEESGILDTDFHSLEQERNAPLHESVETCGVVIGDRVSIGARSLVLKGIRIGDDVIVGPGSVVSRSLGDGCVALGNPARPVEPLTSLPTTGQTA